MKNGLLIVFFLSSSLLASAASENLLPGFERWYKSKTCRLAEGLMEDSRPVVTIQVPAKGFGVCQSPSIPVKPNTRYRITYQVKTENFTDSKAYIFLQIGKRQQIFPTSYKSGNQPWTRVEVFYITRANERSLMALLTVYGKGGQASFTLPDFCEADRTHTELQLPFRRTGGLRKNKNVLIPNDKIITARGGQLYFSAGEGDIHYLNGGGFHRDAQGISYINHVDNARYSFYLPQGGRYRRWFRTWRPIGARYCHAESLDGRTDGILHDDFIKAVKQWEWVPGPVYTLKAGYHELLLHSFSGGIRLASILFAPEDFSPEKLTEKELLKASYGPFLELESAPVRFPAQKWLAAAVRCDPADLNCRIELSEDGGKTFRIINHRQGYMTLPELKNCPVFRIRIAGDNTQFKSIRFEDRIRCRCVMTPGSGLAYRCGDGEYTFNREDGSLLSIRNRNTGDYIVRPGSGGDIFALTLRAPDSKREIRLTPADFVLKKVQSGKESVSFHYRNETEKITVAVICDFTGKQAQWRIRVENGNNRLYVLRTLFPYFAELSIGKTPADDTVIFPQSYVKRIYPAQGGRSLSREAMFPASMSMGWTDLYDPAGGGFFLMIDDPDFLLTRMACGPSANNNGAEMIFEKRHSVPPGRTAEFCYRTAVHPGDWHQAADLYRAWAEKHIGKPDLPQWLRESNGLYANSVQWRGKSAFSLLPGLYLDAAAGGLDGIVSWGQQSYPKGPCGDGFYYPSPCFGSAEELRAANLAIRKAGGHSGFYQWMNWNEKYESSSSVAFGKIRKKELPADLLYQPPGFTQRNQVIQENGKPHFFTLKSMLGHKNYLICPQSAEHRKYLEYYSELYARDFLSSGFYMDEGLSQARPCFNLRHGHFGNGSCGREMAENLRRITLSGRKYDPDFFVTPEVVNCLSGQYGAHFVGVFEPDLEIIKYTFPSQVYLDGNLPVMRQKQPKKTLETIFLLGNHLFLWPYGNILSNPQCRKIILLRRSLRMFFAYGTFRDTVGFSLVPAAAKAQVKRFEIQCEGINGDLFTVLNPKQEKIRLEIPGKAAFAWVFNQDGGLSGIPVRNGSFALPQEDISAVLVPYRTERDVFLHQVRITRKNLTLRIANPGTEDISVRFELRIDGKVVHCRIFKLPPGKIGSWNRPLNFAEDRKYLPAAWTIISGSRSAGDRLVLK